MADLTLFPLPAPTSNTPPLLATGALTLADELLLAAQSEEVQHLFRRLLNENDVEQRIDAAREESYNEGYDAGFDAGRQDALEGMRSEVYKIRTATTDIDAAIDLVAQSLDRPKAA